MPCVSNFSCIFAAANTISPIMTKRIYIITFALIAMACAFVGCKDDVTYAEMRKTENKSIESFLKKGCMVKAEDGKTTVFSVDPIKVISEEQFEANDSMTDVSKNEYVLFAGSGVYMQIVRKGCGEKLKSGENCRVICRFHEFNISTDSLQLSNRVASLEQLPDVMSVSNNEGKFTASFLSGLMYQMYGSAVPGGWMMALPFVNLGRQSDKDDEIAKVRLIVPSSEGQSYASKGIYACFYEITMQRGR